MCRHVRDSGACSLPLTTYAYVLRSQKNLPAPIHTPALCTDRREDTCIYRVSDLNVNWHFFACSLPHAGQGGPLDKQTLGCHCYKYSFGMAPVASSSGGGGGAGCLQGRVFGLTGELPRREVQATLKAQGATVRRVPAETEKSRSVEVLLSVLRASIESAATAAGTAVFLFRVTQDIRCSVVPRKSSSYRFRSPKTLHELPHQTTVLTVTRCSFPRECIHRCQPSSTSACPTSCARRTPSSTTRRRSERLLSTGFPSSRR